MQLSEKQSAIIDKIRAAGWKIEEVKRIHKEVWIIALHPDSKHFLDKRLTGLIGPRGQIDLHYEQFASEKDMATEEELNELLHQ